jgi:hypothetical protein
MSYKQIVKYRIDLKSVFNRAFLKEGVKRGLYPLISDPMIKRAYGRAVIDEIVRRTQDERIDKRDNPLRGYTKAYAESLAGQVYGKSAGERANLTLTGEMLASMDVQNAGKTEIYIKFVDETNAAKAHGHINGLHNKRKYVRNFFGLPKEVETDLLKKIIGKNRDENLILKAEIVNELEQSIITPGQEIEVEFE